MDVLGDTAAVASACFFEHFSRSMPIASNPRFGKRKLRSVGMKAVIRDSPFGFFCKDALFGQAGPNMGIMNGHPAAVPFEIIQTRLHDFSRRLLMMQRLWCSFYRVCWLVVLKLHRC